MYKKATTYKKWALEIAVEAFSQFGSWKALDNFRGAWTMYVAAKLYILQLNKNIKDFIAVYLIRSKN